MTTNAFTPLEMKKPKKQKHKEYPWIFISCLMYIWFKNDIVFLRTRKRFFLYDGLYHLWHINSKVTKTFWGIIVVLGSLSAEGFVQLS